MRMYVALWPTITIFPIHLSSVLSVRGKYFDCCVKFLAFGCVHEVCIITMFFMQAADQVKVMIYQIQVSCKAWTWWLFTVEEWFVYICCCKCCVDWTCRCNHYWAKESNCMSFQSFYVYYLNVDLTFFCRQAEDKKTEGNAFYSKKDYTSAVRLYTEAIGEEQSLMSMWRHSIKCFYMEWVFSKKLLSPNLSYV